MYTDFDGQKFEELKVYFDLPENKIFRDFSQGMKAKVKMLIALSHPSKFLLLDEPMNGLDVPSRMQLICLLQDYMEEDEERTILISSHISADLERLCDEIILINNGRILLQEELPVILDQYKIIQADPKAIESIDSSDILARTYGKYSSKVLVKQPVLTQEKEAVIENCTLDDLLVMMIKKENNYESNAA